jgi:hypothetical protein
VAVAGLGKARIRQLGLAHDLVRRRQRDLGPLCPSRESQSAVLLFPSNDDGPPPGGAPSSNVDLSV